MENNRSGPTTEVLKTADNRRRKGTDFTAYLWDNIPRELIAKAKDKCRRQIPPISLKWKLIELLTKWIETDP